MSVQHVSSHRTTVDASPDRAEHHQSSAPSALVATRPVPGLLYGADPDLAGADRPAVPAVLRRKAIGAVNKTGLPDQLKSGLESLSGLDLSTIKVHYNSDKPAQLNALAYAQGTDIHVAPGQEAHLPHKAWHVVQQMQGRVRPTSSAAEPVEDESLEAEAEKMGEKAAAGGPEPTTPLTTPSAPAGDLIQTKLDPDTADDKLLRDLAVKKSEKDVATALKKMMTEVRKLAVTVTYDDVVAAVKQVGLNPERIGKVAASLEKKAAAELDEDLSGGRGHMMGRHYAVDSASQTKRAKDENRPQVTRVDKDNGSGHRYINYVTSLKKKVPSQLRDHVEDITTLLFRNMQDDGWTTLSLGNKKTRLTTLLGTRLTTIEYPGWEIKYVWTVNVTVNGTKLTCAPEIESNGSFSKIETALEGDEANETKAMDALNMFWGSNKLVIEALQPDLTETAFATKLSELDYSKLGVTQY